MVNTLSHQGLSGANDLLLVFPQPGPSIFWIAAFNAIMSEEWKSTINNPRPLGFEDVTNAELQLLTALCSPSRSSSSSPTASKCTTTLLPSARGYSALR